jgi:hypothetical protein
MMGHASVVLILIISGYKLVKEGLTLVGVFLEGITLISL